MRQKQQPFDSLGAVIPLLELIRKQLPEGGEIISHTVRASLHHHPYSSKRPLIAMFAQKTQGVHVLCPLLKRFGYKTTLDRANNQKVIWDFDEGKKKAKFLGRQISKHLAGKRQPTRKAPAGLKAVKNPPWTNDELILALDLYFRHNPSQISQAHPEVIELSELLNKLPIHANRPDVVRFRNPNGVYMKLCNFLRFDPSYSGTGLARGGKLEKQIWQEFANDRLRLSQVAKAIKDAAEAPIIGLTADLDEDEEAPEGRVLLRQHKVRERNQSLVRNKKAQVLKRQGKLWCEVCSFDFQAVYGELGEGFIECHHTVPVSKLHPGHKTQLKDLALVCGNCHRMLHRGGENLTIKELMIIIKSR